MTAICAGYGEVISDGTKYSCADVATVTVTAGCIHEHVGPRDVCDFHASEITQGVMKCGDCSDSDSPHTCMLRELASEPVKAAS